MVRPLVILPACAVRRVEDFIVKYREVEGQSQANRVRGRQLAHGNITSGFVCDQTVLRCFLPVVPSGKLCQVPVVVTLPTRSDQERREGRERGRRQGRETEEDSCETIGHKFYKLWQNISLQVH